MSTVNLKMDLDKFVIKVANNLLKSRPPITTHILDTSKGTPAENVTIELAELVDGNWINVATGKTDKDGRCNELTLNKPLAKGTLFRLYFDTGRYYSAKSQPTFYAYIAVVFQIDSPNEHYHVPLLLNPFGYSTYRGS